jgi:putative hydrolase of the HAD superfamily
MSITTVVFDFGNVVAFFSHRKAAEQLAAYGDASAEAIHAYLFGGRLEDDYEAGRLSTASLIGMVRATFHLSCTDDEFRTAFADIFAPNPDVCGLVPALKEGRHRLVLLSNTNELHAGLFLRQFADTLGHFDALVLSHEVGLRKPDPRVFAECQRRAGAGSPAECLFLDDLPTNVEAARACGWHGLVYRPGDDLRRRLAEFGVALPPLPEFRSQRSEVKNHPTASDL